jgi:predicted nucleic acid-binding protein
MPDNIFIDTNILIYLIDEDSPFHQKCIEKFTQITISAELWISRQVIREHSVITTRSGIMQNPLSSNELNSDIMRFESIFNIANDTKTTTDNLIKLIEKYSISGKKIHDANIVASMIEYDIKSLFTNNGSDFKRYDEINLIGLD